MTTTLAPEIREAIKAWPAVASILSVPQNEAQYRQMVELLDRLVDEVREDENHPLASLLEVVGVLIERYEDEHVPMLETGSLSG